MRNGPFRGAPIRVGEDAWVGKGTAVLKGTDIGPGAIIGANAVVRGEIPENAVAVVSRRASSAPGTLAETGRDPGPAGCRIRVEWG
jgi:carbonic anhydrase/acetyltransferase-like protein (isoleucine patch superfamily)